jgi:competence protein ComEA
MRCTLNLINLIHCISGGHLMKTSRTTASLVLAALVLTALPALAAGTQGIVNVNSASAEQLALLPRVGPAIAQRIVEFREQNGPFKAAEQLLLVRGIGEATFELIKPYVALAGATTLTEKVRVQRQAPAAKEG